MKFRFFFFLSLVLLFSGCVVTEDVAVIDEVVEDASLVWPVNMEEAHWLGKGDRDSLVRRVSEKEVRRDDMYLNSFNVSLGGEKKPLSLRVEFYTSLDEHESGKVTKVDHIDIYRLEKDGQWSQYWRYWLDRGPEELSLGMEILYDQISMVKSAAYGDMLVVPYLIEKTYHKELFHFDRSEEWVTGAYKFEYESDSGLEIRFYPTKAGGCGGCTSVRPFYVGMTQNFGETASPFQAYPVANPEAALFTTRCYASSKTSPDGTRLVCADLNKIYVYDFLSELEKMIYEGDDTARISIGADFCMMTGICSEPLKWISNDTVEFGVALDDGQIFPARQVKVSF